MNHPSFTHLHVHSQYSIMDGLSTIPELVDKAIADGKRGMALTDHGNMFGTMEFLDYVESKNSILPEDKKFKPIIGCEMWVVKDDTTEIFSCFKYVGSHLTVLAKNLCGYTNLIKLVSDSWTEGFYVKPRTNHAKLAQHHEGLIVCSGCLGSEVAEAILSDNFEEAECLIIWYKETFGDDYYLELQRCSSSSDCVNQIEKNANHAKVNEHLIRLGNKLTLQMDNFVRRGIEKGYPEDLLKAIWNEWEYNAPNYFNKSHSVCYTLIAYQTVYLKANYPEEYNAAYNDWKTE